MGEWKSEIELRWSFTYKAEDKSCLDWGKPEERTEGREDGGWRGGGVREPGG